VHRHTFVDVIVTIPSA